MLDNEDKKVLIEKFDYFNGKNFDDLYPVFCEQINKFRREQGLPILALPTLLTCLLGDALDQSYDLIRSEKDKFHADFFLSDYGITLKKLNDFILKKK
ncbi:MAG: hypothetical protein V3V74_07785 [Nitrosomonadaceae bacterium]